SARINSIAGNGTAAYSGDGEAAANAQLSNPNGVALDSAGNVYIADTSNFVVRVVNRQHTAITVAGVTIQPGNIATVAGTGTMGYSGDGNAALEAQLGPVFGIAVDVSGNIFIADAYANKVRKINSQGTISTYAGSNTNNPDSGCAYFDN